MIAPYFARLLFLCFATFFVLHTILNFLVAAATPALLRRAQTLTPRSAARLLFSFRVAPVTASFALVMSLCVPSYVWFEPHAPEGVGYICLAFAGLGGLILGVAVCNAWTALRQSLSYASRNENSSTTSRLRRGALEIFVIDQPMPVLSLAGFFRPRLILSRSVLDAFSGDELAAALLHEDAHRCSRDNWKRLLLILCPGVFPLRKPFAALERAWARFSELAADDAAVDGDPRRALSLASALVRFAQQGVSPAVTPLVSSLAAADSELADRVDRLLRCESLRESQTPRRASVLERGAIAAATIAVAAIAAGALPAVHELLEHLIR